MLSVLRKYQKIIFATAGILVIFSMSFFGIASQGGRSVEHKNTLLGHALDGSKVYSNDMHEFVYFLSHLSHPGIALTTQDEDVIENDFLKSGLAVMLIETYQNELKEELEGKIETFKRYRPYQHPELKFINAENIWMRFAPKLFGAYMQFKESSEPLESVKYLIDTYVAQSEFPQQMLRQVLYFHERQFSPKILDPYIQRGNLAIFNVNSPNELLGPKFFNLLAQFIHNGALYAKQKGYKVSIEEAKASLASHAMRALKALSSDEKIDGQKLTSHYKTALKRLHIPEKKAVHMWQKVLLFKRLLEEAEGSVFLDTLAYDQINQFAKETFQLSIYHLPETLAVDNFEKMMKLELYLDNVAKRSHTKLTYLPDQYHSVDRVRSRCPKLIGKAFDIEVATLPKSEVALHVSLKELTEYETLCFNELKTQFPELAHAQVTTLEEKLKLLDELDPKVKEKVDHFVKEQIIAENESWIASALEGREKEAKHIVLNVDDINSIFEGFEDNNTLIDKFERALVEAKRTEEPAIVDLIGKGQTFYRVYVHSKEEDYNVLTYKEAESIGALDRLLDERLEREYPNVRSAHPSAFKNAAGEFKPLSEVKEDVGRFVFSEAIAQLDAYLKEQDNITYDDKHSLDEIAKYRMHAFISAAQKELVEDNNENILLGNTEVKESDLGDQFKLQKQTQVMSRSEPTQFLDEQIFRMKKGEWSPVAYLPHVGLGFFHIDDKHLDDAMRREAMQKGQQLLVEEARRVLIKDLLNEIESRQAVHFEKESEETA